MPRIIRALGSRNYRLYFSAQAVSQTGLWMQRLAMGWLVYRLTDSPMALGVVDFLSAVPTIVLIPLTSFLLPKVELRNVLLVTQSLLMLCAAVIGVLTLLNLASYFWLAFVALCIGVVNAFDMPVRQSMVVYLVDDDRDDMTNALALNSTLFNAARVIGPTVAGILIHRVGEGVCFLFNSIAYSTTILAVKSMRLGRSTITETKDAGGGIRNAVGSLSLLREFPPFAHILMLVTAASVFGVPYLAMMPAMARTVLGGTSETMGFLLTSIGCGALAGSLVMAARKSPVGLEIWAARCTFSFGLSVSLFSLSRWTLLSGAILALVGFFMVTSFISCNTLLQTFVDNERRSQIMTLYVGAVVGIAPFGSVFVGQLGKSFGISRALCVSGLICSLFALYHAGKLKGCRLKMLRAFYSRGYRPGRKPAQQRAVLKMTDDVI